MWITNSVFQGAGNNSRAIDTNTVDKGVPELYISGTSTALYHHVAPAAQHS